MSTTVSNQAPVTPVVINTASIISNSQDTVLRLAASPALVGNVTVTVTATNASHETATQSLQVKVIANTFNDPPFFGPIPPSIVVTQYTAPSFQLMNTDLEGDPLTIFPVSPIPTNFTPSIDASDRFWFVPDVTTTGTFNLFIGLSD